MDAFVEDLVRMWIEADETFYHYQLSDFDKADEATDKINLIKRVAQEKGILERVEARAMEELAKLSRNNQDLSWLELFK